MSLGQWIAIVGAHEKAHGGNKPEAPTDEEFETAIIRAREITNGSH